MTELRCTYKVVDGIDIPTDIHLPSKTKYDKAPVLIMIHGGGFILGYAKMDNRDQIQDCLDRGWIVLSIEYRLCPGVDVFEGAMADVRDVLQWAQSENGLQLALKEKGVAVTPDPKRVMAMGASAGGHLALSLAWNAPNPPLAILDFYGAKHFKDDAWSQEVVQIKSMLPPAPPDATFEPLYKERTVFIGGQSLEGQSGQGPNLNDPRQAFTLYSIAHGRILQAIWPKTPNGFEKIDPVLNVNSTWPPTCFVHGTADFMIPMHLSYHLDEELKKKGVKTEFIEVEGEPHTFLGTMVKGSKTWNTQRRGFDFLEKILLESME